MASRTAYTTAAALRGTDTKPFQSEQDSWESFPALPTLPSVLFRFMGLLGDPEIGAKTMADFVWKDPALLARFLPMAAKHTEPSGCLRDTIADLGRERLRKLAYTTPLLHYFEPIGTAAYAATYWERSILCAHACEAAARHLELPVPERYYLAGLFHDIGYLALLHKQPTLLPAIVQRWVARPTELLQIETEMIGMDHCQLGLRVASKVGLDPWIYPAIAGHHSPTSESPLVTRITCIASAFCNSQGLDFFPGRSLSPVTRAREVQEIVKTLAPLLSEDRRVLLIGDIAGAVRAVRSSVAEVLLEWQVSGETRVVPHYLRPMKRMPFHPSPAQ